MPRDFRTQAVSTTGETNDIYKYNKLVAAIHLVHVGLTPLPQGSQMFSHN
jgi:hypothetical protein